MEWKNIYRGIIMGASDVVPGVSGGTIAVLLGIYDRFIAAINGIFSKEWKKHIGFLIPLPIGVAIAILSLIPILSWLLEQLSGPPSFFFLVVLFGDQHFLFREAESRTGFKRNLTIS